MRTVPEGAYRRGQLPIRDARAPPIDENCPETRPGPTQRPILDARRRSATRTAAPVLAKSADWFAGFSRDSDNCGGRTPHSLHPGNICEASSNVPGRSGVSIYVRRGPWGWWADG